MKRFPKKKGKEGDAVEKDAWTRSQMIKTLSQKCRDCGRQKKSKKDLSTNEDDSDEDKEDKEEEVY